jgi:hypothetical protein
VLLEMGYTIRNSLNSPLEQHVSCTSRSQDSLHGNYQYDPIGVVDEGRDCNSITIEEMFTLVLFPVCIASFRTVSVTPWSSFLCR